MGNSVNATPLHRRLADRKIFRNLSQRPKHHVRSGAIARDFDSRFQIFLDCFQQRIAAGCIAAAQSPQVAFIHSRVDELRKSFLFKRGGVQIVKPLGRDERSGQRLRHNQVSDAQSRKHGARECPKVDDAAFGIQPLERLERPAFVVELAVVIVFDNDRVLAPRSFPQFQAPGQRKNGAGRKLMR